MRFRCWLLLAFIPVLPVHGLEICLAPVAVLTEESSLELSGDEKKFTELYFDEIKKADSKNVLRTVFLDENRLPRGKVIKSTMDALELCETYRIDYLMFGYYRKAYQTIEAEIRIFDRERKEVRKTFYAKAEPGELPMMRADLAERFVAYMYAIVGVEVKKEIPRMFRGFGGFELSAGVGYWTPTGDWFGVYTGVAQADLGLLVHPEEELFWIGEVLFMYRFGLLLEYRLGLSKPDLESTTLHSAKAIVPIQFYALFLERHAAYLGLALYYQLDLIHRVSVFGSPDWLASGALGTGASLGYEYWPGEKREYCFGVEISLDVDFYETISLEPALNMRFRYRIPFGPEPTGQPPIANPIRNDAPVEEGLQE